MKKDIIKISFIGDIMCEKPLLKASLKKGEYNFDIVFENMKSKFQESDYVVGNLETVCAGKDLGYTNHIYSFNTPDEFINSVKKSGIHMVTTATNHCLDRGVEGLKRNLIVLKKYGLENIGTYSKKEDKYQTFVKEFQNLKISFLNYTYGTNTLINKTILKDEELFHVNLLKPQTEEIIKLKKLEKNKSIKSKISKMLFKFITIEQWIKIKRKLGLTFEKVYKDDSLEGISDEYLNEIKMDIQNAKKNSDFVIMCMHSGGQFNVEPGKFSKYMMNFFSENGVDFVIGNHPHIVQQIEKYSSGMLGAYSLGNFSISPSSVYIIHEDLPEYSIMLHLYFDINAKKLENVTFSILKIVEYSNKKLTVFPVKDLFEIIENDIERNEIIKNSTIIYNRFLSKNVIKINIEDEYLLT